MALKFTAVFTAVDCLTLSTKVIMWTTSRQVYLLCRWENDLAGILHHKNGRLMVGNSQASPLQRFYRFLVIGK